MKKKLFAQMSENVYFVDIHIFIIAQHKYNTKTQVKIQSVNMFE